MSTKDERREGVLVIGAWIEPGVDLPLRARVVASLRHEPHGPYAYATSTDEVLRLVRLWLEQLLEGDMV